MLAAIGFVGLLVAPTHADIEQQIFFSFDDDFDPFNGDIRDGDRIEGVTDADIDQWIAMTRQQQQVSEEDFRKLIEGYGLDRRQVV